MGGDGAPPLPPRPCWGPAFLFSLLLTWLIVSFRKGISGVKENGVQGPLWNEKHLNPPPQLGDLGSPPTCSEPWFPHFSLDIKNIVNHFIMSHKQNACP